MTPEEEFKARIDPRLCPKCKGTGRAKNYYKFDGKLCDCPSANRYVTWVDMHRRRPVALYGFILSFGSCVTSFAKISSHSHRWSFIIWIISAVFVAFFGFYAMSSIRQIAKEIAKDEHKRVWF